MNGVILMNLIKKIILIVMLLMLCGCTSGKIKGNDVVEPVVTTAPSQTSYPVETRKPEKQEIGHQENQNVQDDHLFEENEELPEFDDVGIELEQQENESSNEEGLHIEEENDDEEDDITEEELNEATQFVQNGLKELVQEGVEDEPIPTQEKEFTKEITLDIPELTAKKSDDEVEESFGKALEEVKVQNAKKEDLYDDDDIFENFSVDFIRNFKYAPNISHEINSKKNWK